MKLKFGANLRHESGHHGTMRPTVRPKNERYRRTVFIRKNYNCRALYMGVFRLRMTLKLFILYLFWTYCCSQICHLFCCKILQGHIVNDGVRQQDVILKIFFFISKIFIHQRYQPSAHTLSAGFLKGTLLASVMSSTMFRSHFKMVGGMFGAACTPITLSRCTSAMFMP